MNLLSLFRPKENPIHVMKKFSFLSNVEVWQSAKKKESYSHPNPPYFLIVSDILLSIKPGMFVLRHPLTGCIKCPFRLSSGY
jgi:hypothetical protein